MGNGSELAWDFQQKSASLFCKAIDNGEWKAQD